MDRALFPLHYVCSFLSCILAHSRALPANGTETADPEITSAVGGLEPIEWKSGSQREAPCQPRGEASTHDSIEAVIMISVFSLRAVSVADFAQS